MGQWLRASRVASALNRALLGSNAFSCKSSPEFPCRVLGLFRNAQQPLSQSPRCFGSSSALAHGQPTSSGVGLFGNPDLQHPSDWTKLAKRAEERCGTLLERVLACPADVQVVQLMDDMSDELCRVYDAAECCRNVHASPEWRGAATQACIQLGAYISDINHHQGLYRKLCQALDAYEHTVRALDAQQQQQQLQQGADVAPGAGVVAAAAPPPPSATPAPSPLAAPRLTPPGLPGPAGSPPSPSPSPPSPSSGSGPPLLSPQQLAAWCPESLLVARKLKLDMEQAGIALPAGRRARMAELMNANHHYAAAFNAALTDPREVGSVRMPGGGASGGGGGGGGLLGRLSVRSVPLDAATVAGVMAAEPDERVRRKVYLAAGSGPSCNQALLDHMIAARREMAQIMGYPSYSHLKAAANSLAERPEAIRAFLERLATDIRPLADKELQRLAGMKSADTRAAGGAGAASAIAPWDLEFYMARARRSAAPTAPAVVSEYLSLPRVLQGLAGLLGRLLRLRLDVKEAAPGEGWAPGVLRLDVSHDEMGRCGTVYLDLFDRPSKYPSAVTFPLTCGRMLPNGGYQQPVMALLASCSAGPAGSSTGGGGDSRDGYTDHQLQSASFTYREFRVLLHELGHACHNLLSRTHYQHLWGSRCAQDLVEVPSHLFEHFASDPRAMGLMARHRSSGEPMPAGLLSELNSARLLFGGLELQSQLVLSLADQAYFGVEQVPEQGSTSAVWQRVVDAHSSVPFVPGTRPELRIGHLTIYGGAYYSYVYARCLAAQLWGGLLAADPLDPGAGDVLRERLLQPGGGVEPLQLLAGLATAIAARPLPGPHPHGAAWTQAAATDPRVALAAAAATGGLAEASAAAAAADTMGEGFVADGMGGLLQRVGGGWAPQPDAYLGALLGHGAAGGGAGDTM